MGCCSSKHNEDRTGPTVGPNPIRVLTQLTPASAMNNPLAVVPNAEWATDSSGVYRAGDNLHIRANLLKHRLGVPQQSSKTAARSQSSHKHASTTKARSNVASQAKATSSRTVKFSETTMISATQTLQHSPIAPSVVRKPAMKQQPPQKASNIANLSRVTHKHPASCSTCLQAGPVRARKPCPICQSELRSLGSNEESAHVNACLDNPPKRRRTDSSWDRSYEEEKLRIRKEILQSQILRDSFVCKGKGKGRA